MDDARTWTAVGPADEVTGPPWASHDVAGVRLRLARADTGNIVAIEETCPHMGSPLDRAEVTDGQVHCPRHWYAYDADDGRCVLPGGSAESLQLYPVEVRDGIVHVAVVVA